MGEEAHPAGRERAVLIVGPHSLQNKLLARLIGERTGYPCEVRPPERLNGHAPAGAVLALIDAAEFAARIPTLCASGVYTSIAVINADAGADCHPLVSYPGVKGVFRADVSEEHLVKGIRAIFEGEYWLSRKLLCDHLERSRTLPEAAESSLASLLTRKEMQTLKLLATGNTTDHIAQALKVSPHTVKTHIYNLFRKIRVTNRVQALHWAARNMLIAELQPPR